MTMTMSIISIPPDGYRWQVIEDNKVLRTGRAKSRPEAFTLGTQAIKEVEEERGFTTVRETYNK
jgi:hypothetical protein